MLPSAPLVGGVAAYGLANVELLKADFVWEEKGSAAVTKFYQIHQPVQVDHFAQHERFFFEMTDTLMIAHWPLK